MRAAEQVCTSFWCSDLAGGLGGMAGLIGMGALFALACWGFSKL